MQRTVLALALTGLTSSVLLDSASASAQQLEIAAAADVIAGLEGGGSGYAAGVRRSRTTLRLGADLWIDEWPNNSLGVAAIVEVEPVAAFGADVRYQRRVADDFVFHVGALAILAPEHMFGATFGAAYRIDPNEVFEVNVGPVCNIYFVGADLPSSQVLWQAMLGAGARVQF